VSTTRPRQGAYIWVTWLAPILGGTSACMWAAWFKAHHTYRKISTFQDASWLADHALLVARTRDELIADDQTVSEEEQNKFALTSGGITLAGKPDLIAVKGQRVRIIDCKTGAPRPAHRAQVMIYMAVLPCIRPELQNHGIEGIIQYPDEEVIIPGGEIDAEFRRQLRTTIHAVGGSAQPPRIPSAQECSFCSIGPLDCSERIEITEPTVVTAHDLF
jgi:hypothetical protein